MILTKFTKRTTKRKRKTPAKRNSINSLKKRLDKYFSRYIRMRDQIIPGYCKCITCGRVYPINSGQIHCGHFVSRAKTAVRFNEQNCHAQCVICNSFQEGNHYEYGKEINRRYGEGTAEKLIAASKSTVKLDNFYYATMLKEYKTKCMDMGMKEIWPVG